MVFVTKKSIKIDTYSFYIKTTDDRYVKLQTVGAVIKNAGASM